MLKPLFLLTIALAIALDCRAEQRYGTGYISPRRQQRYGTGGDSSGGSTFFSSGGGQRSVYGFRAYDLASKRIQDIRDWQLDRVLQYASISATRQLFPRKRNLLGQGSKISGFRAVKR